VDVLTVETPMFSHIPSNRINFWNLNLINFAEATTNLFPAVFVQGYA